MAAQPSWGGGAPQTAQPSYAAYYGGYYPGQPGYEQYYAQYYQTQAAAAQGAAAQPPLPSEAAPAAEGVPPPPPPAASGAPAPPPAAPAASTATASAASAATAASGQPYSQYDYAQYAAYYQQQGYGHYGQQPGAYPASAGYGAGYSQPHDAQGGWHAYQQPQRGASGQQGAAGKPPGPAPPPGPPPAGHGGAAPTTPASAARSAAAPAAAGVASNPIVAAAQAAAAAAAQAKATTSFTIRANPPAAKGRAPVYTSVAPPQISASARSAAQAPSAAASSTAATGSGGGGPQQPPPGQQNTVPPALSSYVARCLSVASAADRDAMKAAVMQIAREAKTQGRLWLTDWDSMAAPKLGADKDGRQAASAFTRLAPASPPHRYASSDRTSKWQAARERSSAWGSGSGSGGSDDERYTPSKRGKKVGGGCGVGLVLHRACALCTVLASFPCRNAAQGAAPVRGRMQPPPALAPGARSLARSPPAARSAPSACAVLCLNCRASSR
jgi:hypothetical protein